MKLAVVLLVMLAAILAAATYYESLYDADTARHLVYDSAWFALFLFLLAVNVFCAAAIRYPWKRHQTGFVLTHAGIIVLLVGSLITMFRGVDGTVPLMEGQSSSSVTLNQPILLHLAPDGTRREIPAEFRWDPPREGREYRYPLGDGLVAVVDRYYHHAAQETDYEPGKGEAALRVRLHNSRVEATEWLTPSRGTVDLGPATLRLTTLRNPEDLERFLHPPERGHSQGNLQLLVEGQPFDLEVADLLGRTVPLGDTSYTVRVVRYLPHAVVRNDRLVSADEEPVNPALEVVLADPQGHTETWLLFAFLPQLNTKIEQSHQELPLRLMYSFPTGAPDRKGLELALLPRGRLYYRLTSGASGPVEMGKDIPTGWMDLNFQVEKLLPQARKVRRFRNLKLAAGQEGPGPALRLRIEGADPAGPHWLAGGEMVEVRDARGARHQLGYGLKTVSLGFAIKLIDFEIGYDPGTRNPASYQSVVEVEGERHVIAMNQPLHHRGYSFYQASYQEIEGQPVVSVLAANRDPGLGIKYLGSIMIVGGIATMFYLKPVLARGRRKAQEDSP
ncbi:MAG TPA: cytochrome c biogenesis protein ResB [Candidatus Nitrosotenuis sp.]|nr:cytochrome c biogenesis protein ResB [Candidatus Nitrosotenuis sp.]